MPYQDYVDMTTESKRRQNIDGHDRELTNFVLDLIASKGLVSKEKADKNATDYGLNPKDHTYRKLADC